MNKKIEKLCEKLKIDKKQFYILIIGFAALLVLLLLSMPTQSDAKSNVSKDEIQNNYLSTNEEELAEIISKIEGVGKCKVAITFENTGEYIYAKNIKNDKSDEIVIYDSQQGDRALVICQRMPKISGVAVVCSGGRDPVVKEEIKRLISGLYGIGADRIYVGSYAV